MKTFVGTKVIEAKPMTRGEYNKYRGWTIPADENPADKGYLVRYPDGYESWSPEKQFDEVYRECKGMTTLPETAPLMQSSNYKDRFKAEYKQLVIRYKGLKAMLEKWDKGELTFNPICPRSTYNMQINAMVNYIATLEARAVMENVEL